MKIEQVQWHAKWAPHAPGRLPDAQMVLVFGHRQTLVHQVALVDAIRDAYPNACIVGCSTAGEICGTRVEDGTLVVTAVAFEHTQVMVRERLLSEGESSESFGRALGGTVPHQDLRHVFVLSDGLHVNGSELVRGLCSALPNGVKLSGGLAADGGDFLQTVVLSRHGLQSRSVVLLAFYGDRLQVRSACQGGWDPFGPERLITRSEGNVLYELDDESALTLYKRYLGEHASGLPATGLHFPLAIRTGDRDVGIVRTILSVDEDKQSLTFAGDVPVGSYARLMRANFDRLIDGAADAAKQLATEQPPELAVLVSCVGRKMVLRQRVEEEIEAVQDALGDGVVLAGFYAYGEISHAPSQSSCMRTIKP